MIEISQEKLEIYEEVVYEAYYEYLRNDFWAFCEYWDADFFSQRPFLKEVAQGIEQVIKGEIKRLGISLPPRGGKSYTASLACAWALGREPERSVMRNCCTTTLARKFSYDVRDIVRDKRFQKVFPGVVLSKDKTAVEGWNLEQSKQVGYFCGGVGSTIAGFGCDMVAILDDPIKDVEEAMSELVLEKKWNWYTGVHRARLEGCGEIHITTRWSRRDITGKLEESGEFDKMVVIPALDEQEQSYCENAITTEELLKMRDLNDPFIWNAEFMQNPVEVTGLLFPRDEMQMFDIDKIVDDGDKIAVIDVADTGKDYLACVIGSIIDGICYVIDVVFTQDAVEKTEGQVVSKLIEHDVSSCRVESNSGGRLYGKRIEALLREQNAKCQVSARPTTTNKKTKMVINAGIVREFIRFRDDDKRSAEYKRYFNQLTTTFKDVDKNKHDDAADATTMMAIYMDFTKKHNW
jgi:predicted phage terminase large subunit-like protein